MWNRDPDKERASGSEDRDFRAFLGCGVEVFIWENRFRLDKGNDCLVRCDGSSHQQDEKWSTLRYEFCICILTHSQVILFGLKRSSSLRKSLSKGGLEDLSRRPPVALVGGNDDDDVLVRARDGVVDVVVVSSSLYPSICS